VIELTTRPCTVNATWCGNAFHIWYWAYLWHITHSYVRHITHSYMWHNECWYSIEYTVRKSHRLKIQTETTRDSPRSVTGSAMYSLHIEIFLKCWFNHQHRIQNDWTPMSECTMNVAWYGNWFHTCILSILVYWALIADFDCIHL